MNIKRLIFLFTAIALLIIASACSNKPSAGISSISGAETSSQASENTDADNSSSDSEKNSESGSNSKPKKDNNSKENNSSRTVSVVHKNPTNTSSTKQDVTENIAELDEDIYNALLDELETATPRELRFYSVKNTAYSSTSYVPLDTVSGIIKHYESTASFDDIMSFKDTLMLSKWEAKKFNLHTQPSLAIYFSESLHMNLEFQSKDVSWISICSPIGKSYYVVPEDVYIDILDFYYNIDQ